MVLEWTSAVGVNLLAGVPGPQGLTVLHVAAVMEDGASLAALLTGLPSSLVSSMSLYNACCPIHPTLSFL